MHMKCSVPRDSCGIATERDNALLWYPESKRSRTSSLSSRTAAKRRQVGQAFCLDADDICNDPLFCFDLSGENSLEINLAAIATQGLIVLQTFVSDWNSVRLGRY